MTRKTRSRQSVTVNGHRCRPEIAEAYSDRVDAATDRFGRVLPVRFDFRFPKYYPPQQTNDMFGRMLDSLNQDLRRKGIDREYVWSREKGRRNGREHYHLNMLLNGRKLRSSHSVHMKAQELWAKALGVSSCPGCVHKAQPESRKGEPRENWLDRSMDGFEEARKDLKAWGGYVAKEIQKGDAPRMVREFGCSHLGAGETGRRTA